MSSKKVYPKSLSKLLEKQIKDDATNHNMPMLGCPNEKARRRNPQRDKNTLLRPAFIRDADKIIACPYYNRYTDKTQVFSFYHNDDITRRAQHVQLVSRISRNIGRILNLNLDLIEAIALGHDIGHTPFGHAGERFLDELYYSQTKRHFNHNVQSARVLDSIFPRNISLQVLDGILCHNGEFEKSEFTPKPLDSFIAFDAIVEECYTSGKDAIEALVPSTLEGCVVRICDIVAYLGKDRQDAWTAKIFPPYPPFSGDTMGVKNGTIVNNLVANVVENSYGKSTICMDDNYFQQMSTAKRENYLYIYRDKKIMQKYDEAIKPMFFEIYQRLLNDLIGGKEETPIYRHHIAFINRIREDDSYSHEERNQIVVDYIASMTDDYFLDLYAYLFPHSTLHVDYVSYFNDLEH